MARAVQLNLPMTKPLAPDRGASFDLQAIVEQLRGEHAYAVNGHAARTLIRTSDLRLVLVAMRPGARIAEHQAKETASIHLLSGRLWLDLDNRRAELTRSQVLVLAAGLRHSVEAPEAAAFLLTLGWAKPQTSQSEGNTHMTPIETLVREHRVIERVLDALDTWAHQVVENRADQRTHLGHFVEFFREFVDGCHHGKEETILFKTMVEHGVPREEGPIAVMLSEHDEGRALVGRLFELASGPNAWSDRQRADLLATTLALSTLLRQHIHKEDTILYPMAQRQLATLMPTIERAFARFEEQETGLGEHERLHALADELIGHQALAHSAGHAHG